MLKRNDVLLGLSAGTVHIPKGEGGGIDGLVKTNCRDEVERGRDERMGEEQGVISGRGRGRFKTETEGGGKEKGRSDQNHFTWFLTSSSWSVTLFWHR